MSEIVQQHKVSMHSYADDTQFYMLLYLGFKMNDSKTEMIIFALTCVKLPGLQSAHQLTNLVM